MKMRLTIKNRLLRYDINKPRPRLGNKYTNYIICHSAMMVISWSYSSKVPRLYVLNNTLAKFEATFMKNIRNTEAELKKSVPY